MILRTGGEDVKSWVSHLAKIIAAWVGVTVTYDGLLKKNKDFFLAGFLSENLLFQPRTKEKAK